MIKAEFREIREAQAKPFIERWHYSGRVPTGKNIYFGWFIDGELYAVANYGIGVNPYASDYLSRLSGFEVTNGNLMELKRLCRREPKDESLPLSAFLSRCHRVLAAMDVCHVVAYSDSAYGHTGGIYRASNFKHLGKTNAEFHTVGDDGEIRHRRFAFRYARRKGMSLQQARVELGLKRVETPPKDRWFIRISRRKTHRTHLRGDLNQLTLFIT